MRSLLLFFEGDILGYMKSVGFTVVSLLIVACLIIAGYFALTGLKNPASYVTPSGPTVGDLQNITTDPDTNTTTTVAASIAASTATEATTITPPVTTASASASSTAPSTSSGSSSSATLTANLKKLIANNTTLKAGSKGASVGYVEQFMNLYLKKSATIDNDFGKTLTANVITFQKQNKLPQTGMVGSETLQMMVQWMTNNS